MRLLIIGLCSSTLVAALLAAEQFAEPKGEPVLGIRSVASPVGRPEELVISLQVSAKGTTPIALSQEQFAVSFFRRGITEFYADASFATNSPKVFTVQPNSTVTISLGVATNDVEFTQSWKALRPGKYLTRVHVGSGRRRLFDYEFMGQRHSNAYEFEIK